MDLLPGGTLSRWELFQVAVIYKSLEQPSAYRLKRSEVHRGSLGPFVLGGAAGDTYVDFCVTLVFVGDRSVFLSNPSVNTTVRHV